MFSNREGCLKSITRPCGMAKPERLLVVNSISLAGVVNGSVNVEA